MLDDAQAEPSGRLSLFVVGENLGGEDYRHRLGCPMPGRMIQVGLDVGF